jgi:cell wall-associated NlpC family hydrolase
LKKIVILGAVVILMSCSSATVADDGGSSFKIENSVYNNPNVLEFSANKNIDLFASIELMQQEKELQILENARNYAVSMNRYAIQDQIKELSSYIKKTSYVFSGSTPSGWDCSGLVRWFYLELGIEIPHSASKQGLLKPKVSDPLPGDIVVFRYNNSKNYIHSGIYIGDGNLIHAGFKKGMRTEVISINDPAFANQSHYFVRLMDTK